MFLDKDKITAAFKGNGALGWGEHHPCLFKGTEWFFRTGYRAYLPTEWLPALDGVEAKLRAGAKVADVGCGHGASVVVDGPRLPEQPTFWGFDFHAPSVETAHARAAEAGVAERTTFEVAHAQGYDGPVRPDLLLRLPARHGRPGGHRPLRPRPPRKPAGPCCWWSRSPSTPGRQHHREPDGGPVVHGVVG